MAELVKDQMLEDEMAKDEMVEDEVDINRKNDLFLANINKSRFFVKLTSLKCHCDVKLRATGTFLVSIEKRRPIHIH